MAGDDFKSTPLINPAAARVFNCPSCGAGVTIRAAGQSVTVACGSCAAIIDSANDNYKIIQQSAKFGRRTQVIPLGQRGKLHGTLWEAIGYMERSDGSGDYCWSEYLLFNPQKGFRWLTEFNGHWNFVLTTKNLPKKDYNGRERATYLHKDYYLFHSGTATVSYVIGEFYWQVKKGETVDVEDYISPPEILSREKNDSEVIWSIGIYIDAEDVRTAFQVNVAMPLQSSVAPNQPSSIAETAKYIGKYCRIFVCILITIQFALMIFSKNRTIFIEQFQFNPSDSDRMKVSPQFEIKGGTSNLEVIVSAPVSNSWIEVQSDLVNDENGQTHKFEQGIEFYTGNDFFEGSWSEGSQTSSVILSSIPSGKYHLNIEASGPALDSRFFLNVDIKQSVITWSNFFWALFVVSIFPLIAWLRSYFFEINRWSQSDFSPYTQQREDS